ncbi:AcrR family transcriptional regulator [Microbacterium sp. W4I4]|uniref:TetR/AcrR family transcriptional regulator n=1 Tax=Microbacterium sp. W4I4 TaxID=3042295 RepID=UPI002786A195|nr:TetR/AcrR family transcriptional regulator [Microbacterium sp. W4I4]MDQ0612936.1 AcrR family transcriptional regulator [Microbacterium sp. W4I4]
MRSDSDPTGTRIRILDAAERLFARHGFDGTSTATLASAVGVPKGLLFYYFPTKPDILTALLDERLSASTLDPTLLAVPNDPVQTLVNLGERVLGDRAASRMLRDVIWHESHIRPEVQAVLTRYRHALHDAVAAALQASLPRSVDLHALRAAASAWAATITARPLEPHRADEQARDHEVVDLRALARVLSAGLLSTTRTS